MLLRLSLRVSSSPEDVVVANGLDLDSDAKNVGWPFGVMASMQSLLLPTPSMSKRALPTTRALAPEIRDSRHGYHRVRKVFEMVRGSVVMHVERVE